MIEDRTHLREDVCLAAVAGIARLIGMLVELTNSAALLTPRLCEANGEQMS